jgi:hypothetical protein
MSRMSQEAGLNVILFILSILSAIPVPSEFP